MSKLSKEDFLKLSPDEQDKILDELEKGEELTKQLAEANATAEKYKTENDKLKAVNNRLFARAIASNSDPVNDKKKQEDDGVNIEDIVKEYLGG